MSPWILAEADAGRDLVAAVEATDWLPLTASQMVLDGYLDRDPRERLRMIPAMFSTTREREVIQLLAEGKTSKEVAVTLNLSVKTAETHRTNLDLHVRGRLDAIRGPQRNRRRSFPRSSRDILTRSRGMYSPRMTPALRYGIPAPHFTEFTGYTWIWYCHSLTTATETQ